jgi:hypothetical protein
LQHQIEFGNCIFLKPVFAGKVFDSAVRAFPAKLFDIAALAFQILGVKA